MFLPMFDEWVNIEVTKETTASAVMQFVQMSNPDLQGKELRMYFFSTGATDPFEEILVDRIWPDQQIGYIEYYMTSNNKNAKILAVENKNFAQTKVIKEVPVVEKLTKPTKKPRVVEAFHIGKLLIREMGSNDYF